MNWLRKASLLLFLLPLSLLGQNVTATGSLKTILGTDDVPKNPMVRFTLQNYGGITPRTEAGPITSLAADITPCLIGQTANCIQPNGLFTITLFANDAIQPINSYYSIEFFVKGKFQSALNCVITPSGGNYDLNAGTGCIYGTPGIPPPVIPFPTTGGLGGVKAKTCPNGQFFDALSTGGVFNCDPAGGGWGTIIGDITDQTDLINYINAQRTVDVGITYNGHPSSNLVLVRHKFPFSVSIPAGCTNSNLFVETAANATTVFSLKKNDVQFGTATIAAGGNNATFSCTATSFIFGTDTLKVVAPVVPDLTAGNIGGSIYGTPAAAGTVIPAPLPLIDLATNINLNPNWQTCGNCGDSGGPSGQPNGTFIMTPGNPATFSAAGNYPFNNGFWYLNLGAHNADNNLTMAFEMQFPTQGDKDASQAVEFEMQKNYLDQQYNMAWQACFASCGNKWRVFNKNTHAWEDSGISINPADFAGGKWVSILATFALTPNNTRHVSLTVNGVTTTVNIDHASTPAVEGDYLHPAFQLDSNSVPLPYIVYVRNMNIGSNWQ